MDYNGFLPPFAMENNGQEEQKTTARARAYFWQEKTISSLRSATAAVERVSIPSLEPVVCRYKVERN